MASDKDIRKIKSMASNGKSVNQIKEELDIPKSTVYYHFRKEVGQKQKENQPEILECEEFKGELCGIFAGDGNFHKQKEGHYRIQFLLNYQDSYWEVLEEFFTSKLGKKPIIFHDKNKSLTTLRLTLRRFT